MPVYTDTVYRRVRTLENKASNYHFSMASFSIYTVYHEEPGEQCTVVFELIVTEPASECTVCVYGGDGGGRGIIVYLEYHSVCPIVRVVSPPRPASECVSPLGPKEGSKTLSCG